MVISKYCWEVATQSVKRLFASIDGRKSPKRILRGVPAAIIVANGEGYTLGKALEHMLHTKLRKGTPFPLDNSIIGKLTQWRLPQ